jgi:hypothetical protein
MEDRILKIEMTLVASGLEIGNEDDGQNISD